MNARGIRARGRVLHAMRHWFADQGYVEVPTPVRVPSPAMEEHLFAIRAEDRWLRTSPEFALKRVVAAGLPRIYEIGPCFRARESGPWHGSEFTMCEWYRVGASTADLMDDVESLIGVAADAVHRKLPPWRRVTMRALFLEATGIDLATASAEDLSDRDEPWDDAMLRRFVEDVEPVLTGGIIVRDWPASQAALANLRDDSDWPVADRFEAFLDGVELANAFGELNDAQEQRRRFFAANANRTAAGEEPHPLDEEFVAAVGKLPKTSGIALGVDRLVAVLLGADGIADDRC